MLRVELWPFRFFLIAPVKVHFSNFQAITKLYALQGMKREIIEPRENWQQKVEALGLSFHTDSDGHPYWFEKAYYELSEFDVQKISQATTNLYDICLKVWLFFWLKPFCFLFSYFPSLKYNLIRLLNM